MERLYAQQKDGRFTMVAVSLDATPALVGQYVERSRLTFPVALDPKMDLANSYGVRALPADDPVQRCPDITRARTWLGWEPEVALDEGLWRTIEYFRRLREPGHSALPMGVRRAVAAE